MFDNYTRLLKSETHRLEKQRNVLKIFLFLIFIIICFLIGFQLYQNSSNPTGTPVCVHRVEDGYIIRMAAKDDSVLLVRVSHAPCDVTQQIDNTTPVGADMVEAYVHISGINDYTVDINRDTTKKAIDARAMVTAGVTLTDAVSFSR